MGRRDENGYCMFLCIDSFAGCTLKWSLSFENPNDSWPGSKRSIKTWLFVLPFHTANLSYFFCCFFSSAELGRVVGSARKKGFGITVWENQGGIGSRQSINLNQI